MAAGDAGSSKVPFPFEDFTEGVEPSRFFRDESSVGTDGTAVTEPPPVEEPPGRFGEGLNPSDLYFFVLQPNGDLDRIEVPGSSNLPRRAAPQEPIVHIPGPDIEFLC